MKEPKRGQKRAADALVVLAVHYRSLLEDQGRRRPWFAGGGGVKLAQPLGNAGLRGLGGGDLDGVAHAAFCRVVLRVDGVSSLQAPLLGHFLAVLR